MSAVIQKIVEVTYKFRVTAKDEKSLKEAISDLKESPIYDGCSAGDFGYYSCKRKGKGVVQP